MQIESKMQKQTISENGEKLFNSRQGKLTQFPAGKKIAGGFPAIFYQLCDLIMLRYATNKLLMIFIASPFISVNITSRKEQIAKNNGLTLVVKTHS